MGMNNYWSLVGFEFKKVFVKRSVWVAIALLLAATIISTFATVIGRVDPSDPESLTYYEDMLMSKEKELALSGTELNGELIAEAAQAYATIPDNVYPYTDSDEYKSNAAYYSKVFTTVDSAYTSRNEPFGYKEFGELTDENADLFYNKREQQYRLNLENNPLFTQENVERVMAIDSEVQKPIILEYAGGYDRNIKLSTSNAITIMLTLAFIVSSIFSNEHQIRTDSLILTSKNGKRQTVMAKFFVAGLTCFIIVAVTLGVSYLGCMLVFGFEGAGASIQNLITLLTYNFTMLEITVMLFILTLLAAFMMTAISLFFSAVCKKNSVALILSVLIIILEISGIVSFLGKIQFFFPTSIGAFNNFFTQLSFNILGIELWLYQAGGVVAVLIGSIMLFFSYKSFTRHQVG